MHKALRLLALLGILAGCTRPEPADLVLLNGTVVTVDQAQPRAQAIAVTGDRFTAVGSTAEIRRYIGSSTRVLDLAGAVAQPGFIESHAHFISLGKAKSSLDLRGARTWQEILTQVERAVDEASPGEWILGRGWHQDKWDQAPTPNHQGLPVNTALSALSPANPVVLTHASGHSCIVNQRALELAGITRTTPDPEGGEIVRDTSGVAIGVLRETAQELVRSHLRQYRSTLTAAQRDRATRSYVELAQQECLAKGITTFHDAGVSFTTVDLYRQLVEEGALTLRLYAMLEEPNEALEAKLAQYRIIGFGNHHLSVRAIKRYMDGALGSHGAWLLEPYTSRPESTGLNVTPLATLEETARLALDNGFQLCTHAIGDRANRETLDLYERAFAATEHARNLRWRIEHAQHLHPSDVARFGTLGVIAAMQAIHCTSDGPWVPNRLGADRAAQGAYLWRSLTEHGAVLTNGTDAPVEDVDPIASYHAAVTRRMADGTRFYPEQCLSREQALEGYTINGAYAAFEEDLKGSVTPGKLADITVLSQSLLSTDEEQLLATRVLYTIIGGKVVYAAP